MHPLAWVHRTRQVVRDAIRRASAEPGSMPRAMAVIEALVIGSGEGLDPEQWDAFNRTGVGHLLSISGSHVTMFAGFAAFFGVTLLQRAGSFGLLGLRWHTMQLPRVCFAAFGAIAYTLLAGFGLPAQRTCAMVL
ncbi:MAG: DNA internalization-related competence protein ComEC/Rec2, partial [Betaproteobacteria bacterium]|nr:DNA internalization-related competence protein ComEC/Rec2 [Betaproteobacteria bacterium]